MTLPALPAAGSTAWYSHYAALDAAARASRAMVAITATGNGIANDTAALQAAINAAPNGAVLWLPAGTYLVDGLTLKTRQVLTGPNSRNYTGTTTDGATLAARLSTQTAPVLTLSAHCMVSNITVSGNGTGQSAIRAAGGGCTLQQVTMRYGSIGFDANYQGGQHLIDCWMHENGDGIAWLVDSHVVACVLNANVNGMNLQPGTNDNMIVGNKIEWNDGYGVLAYQSENNAFVGNIWDRNAFQAISMTQCKHWAVTGNVIRRSGRDASADYTKDSHIWQEACSGITVTGNSTHHGKDDDQVSGYDSPRAAIVDNGGTDIVYSANDFTGYTLQGLTSVADGTRRRYTNNLGLTSQESLGTAKATVNAGTTAALTAFPTIALATFEIGYGYTLKLVGRDATLGSRSSADVAVTVSRESGNATVALGPVTNLVGTAFGIGTGTYRLTATTAADGSTVTVSVQNTSANACQVTARLV